MKNIHLFETKNAYDAAKSGLILPRVSYIKNNQDVKYNPQFDANGHDYVEIAGMKWATMNVGAESITDNGLYFQWGDTKGYTYTKDEIGTGEGKKKFASDWSDYTKFTTDEGDSFTKYNDKDGITELELVDDAVHAAWGGSWRMPTTEELDNLKKAVTTEWTDSYSGSGVAGMVLTDKNDKSDNPKPLLFLPACGYAYDGVVDYTGVDGNYWLSSLYAGYVSSACSVYFGSDDVDVSVSDRCYGLCVRGVLDEK